MKRIVVILTVLLAMMLSFSAAIADYYTLSGENQTIMQNEPDRAIQPIGIDANGIISPNPVIEGESPVTGLPWEGRYLPMMVMINNADGGVGRTTPWGAQNADITYEVMITRDGVTRMIFLFSDLVPDSVGPVRSTRNPAIMVHSEWMAGFVFWGGPDSTNNSIVEFFIQTGARNKGILFDGVGIASGVPPKRTWNNVEGVPAGSNLNVNLSGIRDMIADDYTAPAHPFLFTDERLYDDRKSVYRLSLDFGNGGSISHFEYDKMTDTYLRSVDIDGETQPYITYLASESRQSRNQDEAIQPAYRNVIVQRTEYSFANNHGSMPLMEAVGSGNADIFIGGRYIPGYWVRTDLSSPTYYFDDLGNQIVLSRGKTFIAMLPSIARLGYQESE
ncbi:MAG TPA: DUF3048 domain-containing protein [Candidatus Limiplasma sp.]|nr:DUF3048 domain-containing protein [Candidatus Limiplasma sp.]